MINFSKISFLLTVLVCVGAISGAAQTISGAVHNKTTGQPVVGDEVVLVRLGQGMQEESQTKTDAQGNFTLNVSSPNDEHIVQVSHQGVIYSQRASGAGTVEISVYDAVAKIPGLRGPLGIAQVESDGKILKVAEMYDIVNNSDPPVTQARADNYEITIPANAVLDSANARWSQGIWLKVTPDPVKGQAGKYRINFPIRPGDTLYKFTYHLPYKSPTTLHLKVPYPIEKFGVMHPTTMSFKAVRPNTFYSPQEKLGDLKVEAAVAKPTVGDVPPFEIAGLGQAQVHGSDGIALPPQAVAPPPRASTPPVASAPPSSAHPAPAQPPSPADQSRKETWLMIAGILLIVLVGGFMLWRIKRAPLLAMVSAPTASGKLVLDALKEELFQLESDRLHGSISDEEYAGTKQALTKSIERAMAKKESVKAP